MDQQQPPRSFHRVDHLANERTFLAWIRTSIGIMALGFVVEKFAFFLTRMAFFFAKEGLTQQPATSYFHQRYSSILGIILVGLGALISLFAYIRFVNIEKEIDDETYHPSNKLTGGLTILVVAAALFLLIYLITSS